MSTIKEPTAETTTTADAVHDDIATDRVPATPDTAEESHRTVGHGMAALAGAALVAVAIAVGVVAGLQATAPDTPVEVGHERAALERLVHRGLVPAEALEPATGQEAVTERLQNLGLVPSGPTVPALSDTARERAMTRSLVARGLIPRETLVPTTERGHTQQLILNGLVPDGS